MASGRYSHAEGKETTASGNFGHAEGYYTTASGVQSHVEGYHTSATHRAQHVFGRWNALDPSIQDGTEYGTYIEIVGNGTSSSQSNARTLDWDGNEVLSGGLTLGGTITEAQLQALLAMLS